MTDIDEAFLAERERIRAAATKGYQSGVLQGWRWRKHGFAHMPWQVHAPNKFDMADLGTVAFAVERDDAAAIVDAHNHQPALIDEIRRLRAWQKAVVALPGDCWEHADNCCDEWCQGCIAGTKAESDRERLFEEVEAS